ncbi:MAG: glycoside hydrolase family 32 protein [Myxococcales bacterium]|nr:glycoside hydrolase family 32 protein [Myxococcales bacterium]
MNALGIVLVLALASCGMGPFAGEGGGDDNLPQSGAGPYLFAASDFETPADEPYILSQPIVSLTDPAVLEAPEGGYDVYYTRSDDEGSEIWKVSLHSLVELPLSPPERVLTADSEWEAGVVRAPSVVEVGAELFLYYEGGRDDPSIGLARSTDGGRSFSKVVGNPVVTFAKDPEVIIAGDRWLLVSGDIEGEQIVLRESNDGVSFGESRALITARLGREGVFDSSGIAAPALRLTVSPSGREHYGLFYAGVGNDSDGDLVSAIGYQGSFDTLEWFAFLQGEPILAAGSAGAGGPAPLLYGNESLLFVHQRRQGRGRLAVAFGP